MHKCIVSILVAALCFAPTAPADEPKPATSMLGTDAGQVRDDNGLKMKFVWCPPGLFSVYHERPVILELKPDRPVVKWEQVPIRVFLSHGYWLGKFEVRQSEWIEVMRTTPWKSNERAKTGDDFPANCVSWDDAIEFGAELTKRERDSGRLPMDWEYTLPTEAQWERACRAGTETAYCFGEEPTQLGEYAWFEKNAGEKGMQYARPVGQKRANPWGLHDMHGNVWELCRDSWQEKVPGGKDPFIGQGSLRVFRGGCSASPAAACVSAARLPTPPAETDRDPGFRVALTPVRPAVDSSAK